MLKKSVIPLVLLLAMLLTLPVLGAGDGALSAEPVSARAGEQVRIDVQIQNPGLIGMRIFASYDGSLLRLDNAENGIIFEDSHATFNRDIAANPYTMLWDDSLREGDITTSGTLCTLTFTILSDAAPQETNVKIDVDANSTFQFDLERVPVAGAECTVTILPDEEPQIPPTLAIRNYTESRTIDYRTTIQFISEVENPVEGAQVHWFIDGKDVGANPAYTVKEAKKDFTVQAKYLQGSDVLAVSKIETVKVSSGFFAKLIAFFRGLFGRLPQITQAYLGFEPRVSP